MDESVGVHWRGRPAPRYLRGSRADLHIQRSQLDKYRRGAMTHATLDMLTCRALFDNSLSLFTTPAHVLIFITRGMLVGADISPSLRWAKNKKLIACIRATRDPSMCHEFRDEVERCGARASQRLLRVALADDWF